MPNGSSSRREGSIVPKGLQDLARGFNPGKTSHDEPALKGWKIFVIGAPLVPFCTCLRRRSAAPSGRVRFFESAPGVKTPG
jgi:hypothetical protein